MRRRLLRSASPGVSAPSPRSSSCRFDAANGVLVAGARYARSLVQVRSSGPGSVAVERDVGAERAPAPRESAGPVPNEVVGLAAVHCQLQAAEAARVDLPG